MERIERGVELGDALNTSGLTYSDMNGYGPVPERLALFQKPIGCVWGLLLYKAYAWYGAR
jgi:hypothetical protein